MTKLLSAGFMRLRKSRVFWLLTLAALAAAGFMLFDSRQSLLAHPGFDLPFEDLFFQFAPLMGFFTAVLTGLFLGSEYGDGTVRNKLIVGHGRGEIYFANLIVSAAGGMLIAAIFIIALVAVGLRLIGGFNMGTRELVWFCFCVLMLTAAYSAFFTAITMSIQNKAAAAVVCIIAALLILFAGSLVINRLEEPEMVGNYILVNEFGMPKEVEEIPNPLYVSGAARTGLEFLADLLPSGQSIQISNLDCERPLRLPLMSLLFTALCSGVGIRIFKKKDIK